MEVRSNFINLYENFQEILTPIIGKSVLYIYSSDQISTDSVEKKYISDPILKIIENNYRVEIFLFIKPAKDIPDCEGLDLQLQNEINLSNNFSYSLQNDGMNGFYLNKIKVFGGNWLIRTTDGYNKRYVFPKYLLLENKTKNQIVWNNIDRPHLEFIQNVQNFEDKILSEKIRWSELDERIFDLDIMESGLIDYDVFNDESPYSRYTLLYEVNETGFYSFEDKFAEFDYLKHHDIDYEKIVQNQKERWRKMVEDTNQNLDKSSI